MSDGLPANFKSARQVIRQSILSRVRQDQPHSGSVTDIVNRVFDISDRFHAKRHQIENDAKLSTTGRRAALAQVVRSELMPDLAKATRGTRKALSYAKSKRVAFEDPVKVDPTDAVGEMRRQEIRTYLRGLSPSERTGVASQLVNDDAAAAAILDAHPALSGIAENYHGQLRKMVAERVNGPALAELAGVEDDYGNAKSAADMLLNEIVPASGLTPKAFAEEMAPHEAEADA